MEKDNEQYRLLLNSIKDYAISRISPDGIIQSWNEGAKVMNGYNADEVIGKHISIFYPKEDIVAGKIEKKLQEAKEDGQFEDEGWRVRKDGSRFWANVVITAIKDNKGKLNGFTKVTRNFTNRHLNEQRLRESEEKYRSLVSSIKDYAIFRISPDGIIQSWNEGVRAIMGYNADEFIGKHISIFYSDEDIVAGTMKKELLEAKEKGEYTDEGWRLRKDGSCFWANVVITAIRNNKGELRGFTKVTRDFTNRHLDEQKLRESEARYRSLVSSVKDYAIFRISPDGIIQSWNEGVRAIKGYNAEEVIGKHISIFYPKEDIIAKKIEKELQKANEDGQFEDEGWRIRKDGSRFWANVVITAIYSKSYSLKGFTKVTRDYTDRYRDQQKLLEYQNSLEEANTKLKELDHLKSMFLASMSHELRTPLNSIIGFTGIILQGLDGDINPLQKDHLGRANRSAKHLLSLINDVIDLSKIEAGMVEVFLEDAKLNDIINETVSWVQSQADAKGLVIHNSIQSDITINIDRKRLYQCILNFLSNAVKFTETGTITVSTTTNKTNGEVIISVSDTGIGIMKKDQQKLFSPFVRIDSHLRTTVLGTGLGLYLTKKLTTELLNGTVDVQSQLGKGSTFTIRLQKDNKKV